MSTICSFEYCDREVKSGTLCHGHYKQKGRGQELKPLRGYVFSDGNCSFDACGRPSRLYGLCDAHYRQQARGQELQPLNKRSRAGEPQPYIHNGYRVIPKKGHPNAWKNGYMFEHVFVMSEILGRPLTDKENVHHVNGVRDDNRPDNLELWSTSQPYGQRVKDKIAWAREILELYSDFE